MYCIRIRPMKNTGIETPATEIAMTMRSMQAAAIDRRDGAERDAERHGPDQAGEHQLGGGPDRLRRVSATTLVLEISETAEIALQDAGEIDAELDDDRPVEPEILADLRRPARGSRSGRRRWRRGRRGRAAAAGSRTAARRTEPAPTWRHAGRCGSAWAPADISLPVPTALILRSGRSPRLEGCYRALWIILRDAALAAPQDEG